MTTKIIFIVAYLILAPFIGGLLDGIDRKISARMQGRKGPSVFQPFFDVAKLFNKEVLLVNKAQAFLVLSYLGFIMFTGALLYSGADLLLCFFTLTTAALFLVLASCSTSSPFSSIGSQRELLQMMAYEPMVILTAIGFYYATGSFKASNIVAGNMSAIVYLPGIFVGFVFILTIKMRKSPFDLSASHHPHQEIVKGITTELSGGLLAITDIAEWYENVFLLSIVGMFLINTSVVSIVAAVAVVIVVYFLEILIDNTSARMRWDKVLKLAWSVTIIAGGINLVVLQVLKSLI
ncbi:MAG: NADH-quinone oxidoreductase subunit H [Lachnospiraceae bacterium]|nr:NADH-quinone oxidoreductase subunit H [Lachnospiraceae bacterium]